MFSIKINRFDAWPAIKIDPSSIDASDNARLLDVLISSDLSFWSTRHEGRWAVFLPVESASLCP